MEAAFLLIQFLRWSSSLSKKKDADGLQRRVTRGKARPMGTGL